MQVWQGVFWFAAGESAIFELKSIFKHTFFFYKFDAVIVKEK